MFKYMEFNFIVWFTDLLNPIQFDHISYIVALPIQSIHLYLTMHIIILLSTLAKVTKHF